MLSGELADISLNGLFRDFSLFQRHSSASFGQCSAEGILCGETVLNAEAG